MQERRGHQVSTPIVDVFQFLAAHPSILETARQAIQCGCTEQTVVDAIKAAMTIASDEQMKKDLPK